MRPPVWLLLSVLVLESCASIPREFDRPQPDFAIAPARSGGLAEVSEALANRAAPDQSGFLLLGDSRDALDWRLALLDTSGSSLDILYYLWYGDEIGRLMLIRTIAAADRGVRVRLLIDDLILIGKDKTLAALDRHPNIEVSLFNPKRQRKAGMIGSFLIHFSRLNARMHNKLIVADNQAVVLGGRNIGDEYFGLNPKFNFVDLDVLGFGPVARQASELFDHFWNSDWVVPASALPVKLDEESGRQRRDSLEEGIQNSEILHGLGVEPSDWSANLEGLAQELRIGRSEMLYDRAEGDELVQLMRDPLGRVLRSAQQEIDVINAYIIPDQDFIDALEGLTERDVEVRILTNSLASHDVPAVNSHYKKWRKPFIEAGAELYELRADPAIKAEVDVDPVISKFTGLHTKAFVVDSRKLFVGSMNFDPRSVDINTEMGVLIESPSLARDLAELARRDMAPENAWRVTLDEDGKLHWANSVERVTRQPARSAWQRVQDWIFMLGPASQY